VHEIPAREISQFLGYRCSRNDGIATRVAAKARDDVSMTVCPPGGVFQDLAPLSRRVGRALLYLLRRHSLLHHRALVNELLGPLSVLHFGHVQIALGVDVHVVQDVKLSGTDAGAPE
jgi:hypothetical protein